MKQAEKEPLLRTLTLFPTIALVVGSVIGSGIFVISPSMARNLQSAPLLLLLWVLAGVMTLFGAFTQSELASRMPRTGGLYEYLKEIYGDEVGFLYGWANFMIAGSGAIAGISFMFGSYLEEVIPLYHFPESLEKWGLYLPYLGTIFPLADIGAKGAGAFIIIFLTALNIRGVRLGALIQMVSTSSKVLILFAIVAVAFLIGKNTGSVEHFSGVTAKGMALNGWPLISAMTLALSGAFWAYDGWGNVAYVAGEVKDPSRTIPRAIVFGTLIVIAVYISINLSYLYIFPIDQIATASHDRIASAMVTRVLGNAGGAFVALLIILSSFDCANSSILTNGRVYYAMAKQNLFWVKAAHVHPIYRTPYFSLLAQGGWAMVLLVSGSYDLITSMYVFVNWLLYVLMAIGVFLVRFRQREEAAPKFQVPGYPWVPLIFTVFASGYVVLTLIADIAAYRSGEAPIIKSLAGLVLVASGVPFYFYWKRKNRSVLSTDGCDR